MIQMDLETKFKKETGYDAYTDNDLRPKVPSDYYVEWLEEQLTLTGVSKSFNSEEELLQFIYMHTPIAIKPKSKRAKGQLVSAFKSGNAFEQVCKHLAKKLFNVC